MIAFIILPPNLLSSIPGFSRMDVVEIEAVFSSNRPKSQQCI